jgi:hypothetical protein
LIEKKLLQTFITPPPRPQSPDLSPTDYFLFHKLKMNLKGLHISEVADIQEAVNVELKKAQKRNCRRVSENVRPHKRPVYMPMELIKKTYVFSSCV